MVINKTKVGEKVGDKITNKTGIKLTANQLKIIKYIKLNNKITAKELSKKVGISDRKIEENIKKLKLNNKLKRIGAARNGYWEIVNS